MSNGVTFDPDSCIIEDNVTIENDTIVYPSTILEGTRKSVKTVQLVQILKLPIRLLGIMLPSLIPLLLIARSMTSRRWVLLHT